MSTQPIIIKDQKTDDTYSRTGFNASTTDQQLSFSAARVGQPNYNVYEKNEYKISGYYTDWCQYDGRLDGATDPSQAGRGRDLMNVNATAFDKIIIGFNGILGDKGAKQATIEKAATEFERKQWQPTFTDSWGDVLSYRNVGFAGWISNDVMPHFNENSAQGVLGGLKKLKNQNPNLNLSFSIGGWTMSEAFHWMAADATKRKSFIDGVMDILTRFPMFTEIDLDWEYPGFPGEPHNTYDETDAPNFVLLIKELKTAFASSGRPNVKISIAANASVDGLKAGRIQDLVSAGLDGINLMTYDYFGVPWATELGHHTNLHAYPSSKNWSVDAAVDYLSSVGIDLKMVQIGYAAYTRNAAQATLTGISPLRGQYGETSSTVGTFESGSTEYYDLHYNYLDLNAKSGKNGFTLYTDTIANADFLYNPTSKVFMSIDTPRSVKAKGEYVKQKGLGGLFTWTIDMDHGVLVNAAAEGLGRTLTTKNIDMSGYYFSGKTSL